MGSTPVVILVMLVLPLAPLDKVAQGADREYEIKAAYLNHFFQHVEWPKNAVSGEDQMFVLGVLGPDPFGAHLDRLASQTVKNKKIVVRRFQSDKDYQPCHILFIAPSGKEDKDQGAEERLAKALALTQDSPVLLVSDTEGFARKGVMINFFSQENSVKFEINVEAAKRAGLKISSRILSLARIVMDAKERP